MAKNQTISPEEKARLEDEALMEQISLEEAEAKQKAEVESSEKESKDSGKQNTLEGKAKSEEHFKDLNEKAEYKIKVLKNTPHLREGNEHVVSGNIANILIKRGYATLVEAMPEKSKINP